MRTWPRSWRPTASVGGRRDGARSRRPARGRTGCTAPSASGRAGTRGTPSSAARDRSGTSRWLPRTGAGCSAPYGLLSPRRGSFLITRYALPEMAELFTDEARLAAWLEVELLVVEALAAVGTVP